MEGRQRALGIHGRRKGSRYGSNEVTGSRYSRRKAKGSLYNRKNAGNRGHDRKAEAQGTVGRI